MLTPRHVIELTDAELETLKAALEVTGQHGRRSGVGAKLERLPPLITEDGTAYTGRGEQAVRRMLEEHPMLLTSANPHAEEIRATLRRHRLADAKLEISIQDGKPGEERNQILAERRAVQDDLTTQSLRYAMAYEQEDL